MSARRTSLAMGLVAALALAACAQPAPSPTPTTAKPAAPAPAASPAASPSPGAAAAPAAAVDTKALSDFYTGKTMKIIVGSAAGGGYDAYARLVGRSMGKYMPGNPTIIIENMEGAGSLRAANFVFKAAPKDGTVIGHTQGGLFLQQVLGLLQGIEFDAPQWKILGAPTFDRGLCVATSKSGFKSIADSMNPGGRQIILGGNAPGSATWDATMRMKAALDLNLKLVDGYDGTAKIRLAMDNGELDGMCGWGYESVRATAWDRVQSGEYVVIGQTVEKPVEGLEKVPNAIDLAKTDDARQLIKLGVLLTSKVIRPFMIAPEVPPERVAALRSAFESALKDPDLVQEANKSQLEIQPVSGPEIEQTIRELYQMPESLKTKLKQIQNKEI